MLYLVFVMEADSLALARSSAFINENKDEPISETEFKLLYVDLTKDLIPENILLGYPGGSAKGVDKPTPIRGRGRPKGSKNKSLKHKPGKKHSKQQAADYAKHNDFVLPERLKKRTKVESDIIIDLTRRSVAPTTETSFDLKDKVDLKTWKLLDKKIITCTLCSRSGNFAVLGPLFGPYKIIVDKTSNDGREVRGQKVEKTLIVRLHRDCAIWSPGLCFVGSELIGIGRVLSDAAKKVFLKRLLLLYPIIYSQPQILEIRFIPVLVYSGKIYRVLLISY